MTSRKASTSSLREGEEGWEAGAGDPGWDGGGGGGGGGGSAPPEGPEAGLRGQEPPVPGLV